MWLRSKYALATLISKPEQRFALHIPIVSEKLDERWRKRNQLLRWLRFHVTHKVSAGRVLSQSVTG
jgi:hypothetical protein